VNGAAPLRPFEEGDLPALADLWVVSWRETGLPVDFEGRRDWLLERLERHREAGGEIVVGLDARQGAAGFITIEPGSGYLDQLAVAPAEKGSGLASRLLDEAKRLSPGVVELDVNEANLRARRFYEREGFVEVSRGLSERSGLPTLRLRWTRPANAAF
jgi:putative acetyltransferase